jgi:hypothetical protein
VVYEYLLLPHLPFVPDYLEVMSNLCDMLAMLYDNMNHRDTYGYVHEDILCFYYMSNATDSYDVLCLSTSGIMSSTRLWCVWTPE